MIDSVDIHLKRISDRFKHQNITFEVSTEAKNFIVEKGFDKVFGARPLRRALQRYLEDPLSEEILKGNIKADSKIIISYTEGNEEFTFRNDSGKENKEAESKEESSKN